MRCPICKSGFLQTSQLDSNLVTASCLHCGGHWVKAYQYWKWRDALPASSGGAGSDEPEAVTAAPSDSLAGKLCPECGRLLIRYRVGRGVDFHLDRCGNCAGIWFDHLEWENLRARGLHRDAHFIFTSAWQAETRREVADRVERMRRTDHFGEEELCRIDRIRSWISRHPRSDEILAMLVEDAAKGRGVTSDDEEAGTPLGCGAGAGFDPAVSLRSTAG